MKQFAQIEKTLEGLFKDLPSLPASSKETIVKIMPWIALVFGVLQLLAAYWVWSLASVADRLANDVASVYSAYYAAAPIVHLNFFDRMTIYLGAVVLLVSGVIGIMAYKPLTTRARRGWELMFLAALVNLVYSVLAIFINGRGFGSFIMGLIGSAIGFYLLFQIKSWYGRRKPAAEK